MHGAAKITAVKNVGLGKLAQIKIGTTSGCPVLTCRPPVAVVTWGSPSWVLSWFASRCQGQAARRITLIYQRNSETKLMVRVQIQVIFMAYLVSMCRTLDFYIGKKNTSQINIVFVKTFFLRALVFENKLQRVTHDKNIYYYCCTW